MTSQDVPMQQKRRMILTARLKSDLFIHPYQGAKDILSSFTTIHDGRTAIFWYLDKDRSSRVVIEPTERDRHIKGRNRK